MKKFVALFVAIVLCLSLASAAFADSTITWDEIAPAIAAAGWEGEFMTFDEIAVQIWIPSVMMECELDEEYTEAGYIGYYMTEDESAAVIVMYVDADGMTLEDYAAVLPECGATEVEMGSVNGMPCVTYVLEENDSCCIAFATEMGYILEVSCGPYSDDDFKIVAGAVCASIMPAA